MRSFVFLISLFLIFLIFIRVPQESAGLVSFATKTNSLGSPSSAQKFLNNLTVIFILIYLALAVKLNF